jgi:hypothetical protein
MSFTKAQISLTCNQMLLYKYLEEISQEVMNEQSIEAAFGST